MGRHLHLLSYLLTLINPQLLTSLTLSVTITTATYIVTKNTMAVFNKYHLWGKKCKHSYDVLGMYQIHPQDLQNVRTNDKDTKKT